jgi:cation:H+ antiporter
MQTLTSLLAGLGLLFVGGHFLVNASVKFALALRLSPLVIGLTIVAFGSSAPELLVSIDAALTGHVDIVLGNIVGSNIANILLVLGLSAAIYPIAMKKKVMARDGGAMIAATLLFFLLALTGLLGFLDSLLLLIGLFLFLFVAIKFSSKTEKSEFDQQFANSPDQQHSKKEILQSAGIALASIVALGLGSHLFVDGAVSVSRTIGVSEVVIGLTVVAVGTAAPEIVTSVIAAWQRHSDIAIGNVLGSNIFNLLSIGGITALVSPLTVDPHFLKVDFMVLLGCSVALVVLGLFCRTIQRWMALIMLGSYCCYTALLFYFS